MAVLYSRILLWPGVVTGLMSLRYPYTTDYV